MLLVTIWNAFHIYRILLGAIGIVPDPMLNGTKQRLLFTDLPDNGEKGDGHNVLMGNIIQRCRIVLLLAWA